MTRCPPRVQCRGVVPAVSHIMLHSDTLAQEFNDILNGVEIFAPFQPLDPAVTFYAPLRNNVRDLRLNQDDFQRASDAWYKDGSGIYRNAGINRPRFEGSRLLMEPAQTNKCLNYNANPDESAVNMHPNGSVLTREYEPAKIAAAGLQDICSSGFVWQFENQTGGTLYPYVAGSTGNTNDHTASCFMDTFGDPIQFGINSVPTCRPTFTTNALERCQATCPVDTDTRRILWRLLPGEKIQFVLNGLEEGSILSSPIVTEGTAGQRAIDTLNYAPTSAFIDVNEGAAAIDFQYLYSIDAYEAADRVGCLSPRTNNYNSIITHFGNQGGNYQVRTYNNSGNATVSHGEPISGWARYVSTWSVSNNALRISALVDGAWIHGNQIAGNPILDLGQMDVGLLPTKPCRLGEAYILDRYLTTQEVEDMFS